MFDGVIRLGLYYGVSICLVSFASAMAVVTLNIHHRGVRGNEVPAVIKSVVLGFLSKFVFLHFDTSIKKSLSLQATKAKASELRANEKYARMVSSSERALWTLLRCEADRLDMHRDLSRYNKTMAQGINNDS